MTVAALERASVDDERRVVGPQLSERIPLLVVEQHAVATDQVVDLPECQETSSGSMSSPMPLRPRRRARLSATVDSRTLAMKVLMRSSRSGAW